MRSGVLRPHEDSGTFGFLKDRSLSDAAADLLLKGHAEETGRLPKGVTREEAAGVLFPHETHAAGGITLFADGARMGIAGKLPHAATQTDEFLYALHAEVRGRAGADEWTTLARGAVLPGEHVLYALERNRASEVLVVEHPDDRWDRPLRTELGLRLARACGIRTVKTELLSSLASPILFAERFDRTTDESGARTRRLLTLSAATLVKSPLSYLGIADLLNAEGASPKRDLPQVWLRMVFAQMTGMADDGTLWQFVRETHGWSLAEAHALTPAAEGAVRPLTVDGQHVLRSADEAVTMARYFDLKPKEAKAHLAEMRRVLVRWEDTALELGIHPREVNRMAGAFDL